MRYGFSLFALTLIVGTLMWPASAIAQKKKASKMSGSFSPEALNAKAFLEDLLARRYSQELATMLSRDSFSVGAKLDLDPVKPQSPPPDEPLSDLMLGTLDPEALLKKISPDGNELGQSVLRNYRIRKVYISVGVSDELNPSVKGDVEKWLTTRLKSEFGAAGKGNVTLVKIPVKQVNPRTFLDWLSQFQSLAGQLILVLGVLIGILLWKAMNHPITASGDRSMTLNGQLGGLKGEGAGTNETAVRMKDEEEAREKASAEIERWTKKLVDLVPRVTADMESILRSWCQMGEDGKFRLACFAEAVGREIGKLPIPVDALSDVTKVFAKMSAVGPKEKKEALEKAYWDLLSALNLGSESLSQPFGYMGSLNLSLVNQILIDQNPKMRTLVSIFMPNELRSRYIQSLTSEMKRELLENAAQMSEVAADELKFLDGALMKKLKPEANADRVPLEMTLQKMVSALLPSEEATLLTGMTGPALDQFKRSTPSIAFLDQWPDEKLSVLLSRVPIDEIVAFLRVRPELKDRFIRLSPPMTAEMANDELSRPEIQQAKERDQWLGSLAGRIKDMVQSKEIDLEEVFSIRHDKENGGLQGTSGETKQAS